MRYVKIFGERNTGTNALKEVITNNSASEVISSTPEELDPTIVSKILRIAARGTLMTEALIDNVFESCGPRESWKHCATVFEDANVFADAAVVFTVRHPASWMISLFRSPYHVLDRLPESLEAVVDFKWRTGRRERLGGRSFRPTDLLLEKVRSYRAFSFRLQQAGIPFTFMRFEDFVVSQAAEFARIAGLLDRPRDRFVAHEEDTKDRGRSLDHYADYYGNERWRSELEGIEDKVNAAINWKAFARFGYGPV